MVAGLGASLSACHLNLSMQAEARDEWTRTYEVAQGAELDLRTTNGSIRVETIDGNRVEVRATRIVKAQTDDSARQGLSEFAITETATPAAVRIDARGPSTWLRGSRSVDVRIRAPRWLRVTLQGTNSDVEVRDLAGPLRAETTNGRIVGRLLGAGADVESVNGVIDLEFSRIGDEGVRAETTNGAIDLVLPSAARARIQARVTNGMVSAQIPGAVVQEESRRRYDASMNGGGAPVRVETTNGRVRISAR